MERAHPGRPMTRRIAGATETLLEEIAQTFAAANLPAHFASAIPNAKTWPSVDNAVLDLRFDPKSAGRQEDISRLPSPFDPNVGSSTA